MTTRRERSMLEELQALRREFARAHAEHSGPMTVETAAAVLDCSKRRIHELLAEGVLRRSEAPQFGKESLVDARSVWLAKQGPTPRARKGRTRSPKAEAAAVLRLKVE